MLRVIIGVISALVVGFGISIVVLAEDPPLRMVAAAFMIIFGTLACVAAIPPHRSNHSGNTNTDADRGVRTRRPF
jgi:hypothetical protein